MLTPSGEITSPSASHRGHGFEARGASPESLWNYYFFALLPTGETKSVDDRMIAKIAKLADTALVEYQARFPKAESANGAEGVNKKKGDGEIPG